MQSIHFVSLFHYSRATAAGPWKHIIFTLLPVRGIWSGLTNLWYINCRVSIIRFLDRLRPQSRERERRKAVMRMNAKWEHPLIHGACHTWHAKHHGCLLLLSVALLTCKTSSYNIVQMSIPWHIYHNLTTPQHHFKPTLEPFFMGALAAAYAT